MGSHYRIEMIFRESCIKDISTFWAATGRKLTAYEEGQAVFEGVTHYTYDSDMIVIENNKGETFVYNIKDFYRVKIIRV